MTNAEFQLRTVQDARLAVHAASGAPAWLWTPDGARLLWANPTGAALLGAADDADMAGMMFDPADPRRRQIAQLAGRLPPDAAPRLERLRGLGAPLHGLVTCVCSRLQFADGDDAVLVVAAAPVGRVMPLAERLRRLVAKADRPMAAFAGDGTLAGVSAAARPLLGFRDLSEAGLEPARDAALSEGRAEATFAGGHMVLHRVGYGNDIGLVAVLTPPPAVSPPAQKADPAPLPPPPPAPPARDARQPLRFMWQMDAEGRFQLGSDDFTRLIGMETATAFGRPWAEIAETLGLDPQGLVARAVATRETWSGITLDWPVDNPGTRLRVELSGLPVFDRHRNFAGYRGFGVCRDLGQLDHLTARLHATPFHDLPPRPLAADVPRPATPPPTDELPSSPADAPLVLPTDPETALDISENVVPFRAPGDLKPPPLTPVENSAFHELARQLSARLEHETVETDAPTIDREAATAQADDADERQDTSPPARHGGSGRDAPLLDLMPSGLLVYRLEHLLYVNPAFLARLGFDSVAALNAAGGLDALYIDPPDAVAQATSDAATYVTLSAGESAAPAVPATLRAVTWDGEPALALIVSDAPAAQPAPPAPPTPAAGAVNAEELGAILDTMADGVLMFDADGRISACNRSAEALFGRDGDDLTRIHLTDLFAPESRDAISGYLDSVNGEGASSLLDHGREALGRARDGGFIPLAVTMGRTLPDSPNFFAVMRDLTQSKTNEAAQLQARRQAERASSAKADVLARVSHEIRSPLNAIIGFADVMIDERFGPLGHERYAEYLKDIRASGERVSAIVDEMLDLSRIETGKLDLAFGRHDLNDLLEQSVAVMQPRANRERIIIRTSLAHTLPNVVADGRTLRQIVLNLIGNSIHLANAGGQVIVSTALSDLGDVVLRVRDTGPGMNDNELAAAVEPFGTPTPDQTPGPAGVSLALTKALVEANRARFQIKSGPRSGTLIEVTFPRESATTTTATA